MFHFRTSKEYAIVLKSSSFISNTEKIQSFDSSSSKYNKLYYDAILWNRFCRNKLQVNEEIENEKSHEHFIGLF